MERTTTEERWDFLSPWTTLLREHKVHVKTEFLNHHSCQETFRAIELELQPSIIEDELATQAKQQALAEALELVAMALVLFPEAWGPLLVDHCGCNWFKPALFNQETLVPRFELDCAFYPGEILAAKTALRFFEVLLTVSIRRTEAFETAKQHLTVMASGGAAPFARVPLTIAVSTWNELPSSFLHGHATFVEELKRLEHCGSVSWCYVEAVALDITGPGVSSDAVKRCVRLAGESPLVQFARLSLDPNDIGCSSRELGQLVTTVVSTTRAVHLHLGTVATGPESSPSDYHFATSGNQHSSDSILRLMEAIAKAPVRIQSLTVGRFAARESRGLGHSVCVWSFLLRTLFHPSAACTVERVELVSGCAARLENEEAEAEFAASTTPSHKIPPSLTLRVGSIKATYMSAIIRTSGSQLHHLRISLNENQDGPAPVPLILEACSNLKHLELINITLDSFDAFSAKPCRLSTLRLTNIALRSRASLSNFLVELTDRPSLLRRELGEIVVSTQDASLLGPRELIQAAELLRYNGRVHSMQLNVDSSSPESLLRGLEREHREPAAVYQAPLALSSKLAVLSALTSRQGAQDIHPHTQLCRDVVPLIFDFAAECKPRWINVIRVSGM